MTALAYVALVGGRFVYRQHHIWAWDFVRWAFTSAPSVSGPRHLLVFFTDHFEPGEDTARMARWVREFPILAQRHRDSRGRPHQHTWFFPGDQPNDSHLANLQRLTAAGFGEVELHYHHSRDTRQTAEEKFRAAIASFQRFGFARTVDGQTAWAFIHGNFALDNSDDDRPKKCGVSDELTLLRSLGAYADFSFPAIWNESQPRHVNQIYEAMDDPQPKSYDTRHPFGAKPSGRLPIFTGPLMVYPVLDPLRGFYQVEDANSHATIPMTDRRVDLWVKANIHVPGRPEWVFIKVWGHAASSQGDMDENLPGGGFERALERLESQYNDGQRYVLHYVTAREAYNVARAAAAGQKGDPVQFYDYEVKPYMVSRALSHARGSVPTPGGARREHAGVQNQVDARPWRQHGQPLQQLQGIEAQVCRPVGPMVPQREPDLTLAGRMQSLLREWRPQGVPTEPLQPISLAGPDHLPGVEIEPGDVRVFARSIVPQSRNCSAGLDERRQPGGLQGDEKELLFRSGDRMMVAPVTTTPQFTVGKPTVLFTGPVATIRGKNYDGTRDGQRFLMVRADEPPAPKEITVVLNWMQDLRTRVR